jgi:hypothetical protein
MTSRKLALAIAALMAAGSVYAQNDASKQSSAAPQQPSTTAQSSPQQSSNSAQASPQQPSAAAESSSSASAPAASQSASAGDEKVKQTQRMLKDAGFDPGPIDGIMGPRTQAALDQYNQSKGSASPTSSQPSTQTGQSSSASSSTQQTK